jgi:3-hydroxymyristoyl/3-hydroxydecanoyl-(acyl carrier protein) dehydratase
MKFRFVDKITSWSPYGQITGIKAVSFEEYCLKDAFGEVPRLPETLLLESFLQLGNWLILLSSDFETMAMAVRISQVSFREPLRPGRQLRMTVSLTRQRADGFEFSGEGRVGDRVVVGGVGCLAAPVPAKDYVNPDDLRVLFDEIYEPQ